LLVIQFAFGTKFNAISFGASDTVGGAFLDEVTLKLSDSREHMKEQASCGTGRIDILIEHNQIDLLGFDLFGDVGEITHGAREPIETGHDKLIAFAHI